MRKINGRAACCDGMPFSPLRIVDTRQCYLLLIRRAGQSVGCMRTRVPYDGKSNIFAAYLRKSIESEWHRRPGAEGRLHPRTKRGEAMVLRADFSSPATRRSWRFDCG